MIRIRPIQFDDIAALYAISLATGFEGRDASHLYSDAKLMGHIYVAPYAKLEPKLALAVEDANGVAGFAVGAISTSAWEDRLEKEWWPNLRRDYVDPPEAERISWSPDQRRVSMIHHPARTPADVVDKYPAHLHMNLMPRLQGRGLGRKLFEDWQSVADAQGTKGIHVGVNRANQGAIQFWTKVGFAALIIEGLEHGRTLWMGIGLGR
jgi:GNAT superfamily N-acetyltransferase